MNDVDQNFVRQRLAQVKQRIAAAARRVQRDPAAVKLVVVTKGQPEQKIRWAIEAGACRLGENYADEAVPKIMAFQAPGIEWHMIGHIQSRKAALVCQYFAYVHSLDSVKLALRLERFAAQYQRVLPVLLECNASGEATKYGWDITQEADWKLLLPDFEQILALPHLRVEGLMTMAPYTEQPETVRPFFNRLRRFRDFLRKNLPASNWDELSMGMSSDFEVAVEEGATFVRIGQLILGARV